MPLPPSDSTEAAAAPGPEASLPAPTKRRLFACLGSRCAVCAAWPAARLCADCVSRLAPAVPRCQRCALRVPDGVAVCGACLRHPGPLQACAAAVDYAYPWDKIVAAFKFEGDPGWARPLAGLLSRCDAAEALRSAADWVLPVPLSDARLRTRGFQQTALLAQAWAGQQAQTRWLLRLRDTPSQAGLPRQARLRNLQGALALEPAHAHRVRGQRLLLLDDVMTTGATLEAAAQVLWDAGARQVSAVVLARTPAPGSA